MDIHSYVKPTRHEIGFGGWGNGYAVLPLNHPLYGKSEEEIMDKVDLGVELTLAGIKTSGKYKDYWVVGFDTASIRMNTLTHPRRKVKDMTLFMAARLAEYH